MELPQDGTFFVEGRAYNVRKAPKRLWPCQSCDMLDRCGDPGFYGKLPPCRKEDRSDNTQVVYLEAEKYHAKD